ncbi:MAG: hypothetical protein HW380_2842 [Magnetococcales bacterium]|nr:hypothetical protein [Magnetococcales bacterium]HIJ85483.1 DUF2304 domain-containing protein [Magnetococcales bacterium]
MTLKQSVLIFILASLFLVGVIGLVRNFRFREKYSLLWAGISLLFLSIAFFDNFYLQIGEAIGIVSLTSFLSLCAFLTLFLLLIQVTIALSLAFHQRKEIAQNLALLEAQVLSIEKRLALLEKQKQTIPSPEK